MASPVKGNTSFEFWSVPTVEPKRAFKFMVTIPGFQPFLVSKADRPSVTISETPHKFLNHTFYYPGVATWNDVKITFVDPGNGREPNQDATLLLYNKLLEMGYRTPEGGDLGPPNLYTNVISKGLSTQAFAEIKIQTLTHRPLAGTGIEDKTTTGEYFVLKNAWAKEMNFGSFDYNGEDLLQLDVTFRYDFAKLWTAKSRDLQSMQVKQN